MSDGFAECVPACIVEVKVTSHIGRKTTAGDLFLTICDYEWKPLQASFVLRGAGSGRILAKTGLSGCGVGAARGRAPAGHRSRGRDAAAGHADSDRFAMRYRGTST